MAVQTTLQPKCDKKKVSKTETLSAFRKIWQLMVQAMKIGLSYALKNPATWKFLVVHVPDWTEKVWRFMKDVVSFFTDLN